MATVSVSVNIIKKIIQEMVVPDLRDIKTDVATIKVEIKRLDEKIDGGLKRLDEKIESTSRRLDEKIDSLRNEFTAHFGALENRIGSLEREISIAIDIHERLAAVEAKVGH